MKLDRCGHAVLDPTSRLLKAQKIERLLGLNGAASPLRILEIGTGSGVIAHYLATRSIPHQVEAVDVVDSRVIRDGYVFQLIAGTELPFPDSSFDIVVSNHVIEHVGDDDLQLAHLREMRRVMKPAGTGYLATPNRWRLVEPHYRVPLLSVWPKPWRSAYLRVLRARDRYDCDPLTATSIERMFRQTGVSYRRVGAEAVRAMFEIEHADGFLTALVRRTPRQAWVFVERLLPTLVYLLKPNYEPTREEDDRSTGA